eukprot:scaffold96_cov167-Ochromonas_danica.AAC.7
MKSSNTIPFDDQKYVIHSARHCHQQRRTSSSSSSQIAVPSPLGFISLLVIAPVSACGDVEGSFCCYIAFLCYSNVGGNIEETMPLMMEQETETH